MCYKNAIKIASGKLEIDRSQCISCTTFNCTDVCCTGALRKGGYTMTASELYRVIQRDRHYWGSRGGITLTGGEPFYQPDFTASLLKQCHDAYVHTAAETCGDVPKSWLEPSLPFLDWLFFDLKHIDPDLHREWTGRSNRRILENARWLASHFNGRIVYRMTVVPGYNDQPEHIIRVARFIRSSGRKEINLLPLHHLGREKYPLTGHAYYTEYMAIPSKESMLGIQDILESEGISCYLGSETPF